MSHQHDRPVVSGAERDLFDDIVEQDAAGFGEDVLETAVEDDVLRDVFADGRENADRLQHELGDKRRADVLTRLARTDRNALRELRESGRLETMSTDEIEEHMMDRVLMRDFDREKEEGGTFSEERQELWLEAQKTWVELDRVVELLEDEKIGPWYKPWARIKFIGASPETFNGTMMGMEMQNELQAREWFDHVGDDDGLNLLDQYDSLVSTYREQIQRFDDAGLQREESLRVRPRKRVERSVTPSEQAYKNERAQFATLLKERGILLDSEHTRALMHDDWLVDSVLKRGVDVVVAAQEQIEDLQTLLQAVGVNVDAEGRANQKQLAHALQLHADSRLDHAVAVLPALYELVAWTSGSSTDDSMSVDSVEPVEDIAVHTQVESDLGREELERAVGVERIDGGARAAEVDMEYMRASMGRSEAPEVEPVESVEESAEDSVPVSVESVEENAEHPVSVSVERLDVLDNVPMDEEYKLALSHDAQFGELVKRFGDDLRGATHAYREQVAQEIRADGIAIGNDYSFDIRRARKIMSKPVADYYALLLGASNELLQSLEKIEVAEDVIFSKIDMLDQFLKKHDLGDDSIYLYDNRFIEAMVEARGLWDASTMALQGVEDEMSKLGLEFKGDGSVDGRTLRRVKRERADKAAVIDENVRFHSALLKLRDVLIEKRMY